jgi:hypothetical protein
MRRAIVGLRRISRRRPTLALALLVLCSFLASTSSAEDNDFVFSSPRSPWGEFTVNEAPKDSPWWAAVLLWGPNRVMDFIDIFRVDIGIGPAIGAVGRISKFAQFGYRHVGELSVRTGLFGRNQPFMVERGDEYGIGPGFVASAQRRVCPGEIGVGADLLIAGAYVGVCVDQALDFIAGLVFIDVDDDDLR